MLPILTAEGTLTWRLGHLLSFGKTLFFVYIPSKRVISQ